MHSDSLFVTNSWHNVTKFIFLSQKLNFLKIIHSEKANKIGRNLQSSFKVIYVEAILLRIDGNTLFPYWDLTRKTFTRFFSNRLSL